MKFYDEAGREIQEKDIDLTKGYVAPKEVVHHDAVPAVTHVGEKEIPGGLTLKFTVEDRPAVPAYDEVMSQTYILYPAVERQEETDFAAELARLKTLVQDHDAALAELGELAAGHDEAIAELGNAVVAE